MQCNPVSKLEKLMEQVKYREGNSEKLLFALYNHREQLISRVEVNIALKIRVSLAHV